MNNTPLVAGVLRELDDRMEGALTLSVVCTGHDQSLTPKRLLLDKSASEALRASCRRMQARIRNGVPKSYEGTAELDEGEFFVIDDALYYGGTFCIRTYDRSRRSHTNPKSIRSRSTRRILLCVP